jgi:uncharacterized protein involved in exopolysaccharide biosynthesis
MPRPAPNRSQELSQRLYQRLLAAYPRRHREAYGGAMAQLFRDQCRDAWADGRNLGLLALWLRTLPDLLKTSLLERCSNLHPGKYMADKLNPLLRPSRTPVYVFLAVFLWVFIPVFLIAATITFILPESYAGTCRIQVDPEPAGFQTNAAPIAGGPVATPPPDDAFFMQTTFDVIQSPLVLSNVVSQLNLNEVWGKKYLNGERLKTTESVDLLKRRMDLRPVRNTRLIAITVYSEDKNEAAQLANAVAKAYQDDRVNLQRQVPVGGLKVYNEQALNLEAKIQAATTNLEHLRLELGVADTNLNAQQTTPDSLRASGETDQAKANARQEREQPYWEAKREVDQMVDFQRLLTAKIEAEKLDLKSAPVSPVVITDPAHPSNDPVRPNKPLNLLLGAIAGLFLGGVAGSLAALIAHRLARRPQPQPVNPGRGQ